MSRPSKTEQELGYIRDFWTEIRALESEHHGMVSIFASALPRPGVIGFRMVFTPLMGTEENGLGVDALEFIYPNVEQSTLAGFLWRKAISLSRMVQERSDRARSAPKKRG